MKNLPSGNDFEREEYINNYIIENCKYDDAAAQTENIEGNENDAYGALVDGKAVCEGYARAFQLLCNKANIDCVLLSGTTDSANHAWNGVKSAAIGTKLMLHGMIPTAKIIMRKTIILT